MGVYGSQFHWGACAGPCRALCAGFGAAGHPGQVGGNFLLWPGQCPGQQRGRACPALPALPSQPCPAITAGVPATPLPSALLACSLFFCAEVTKLPVIPLCQFFPNPAVVLGNIYLPAASSAAVPLCSVPFPHTSRFVTCGPEGCSRSLRWTYFC